MHRNTRGGDNVRAHSGGKGESDDEHEQASRAIDSYTRWACRDSLAAHHSHCRAASSVIMSTDLIKAPSGIHSG